MLFVKSERERERGGGGWERHGITVQGRHAIILGTALTSGAAGNSHLIITGRMLTHRIRWSDLITAPSDRVSANKRSRVSRDVADNIFINDLSRPSSN